MKNRWIFVCLGLSMQISVFSQEEQVLPQKHIMGYLSVQGEVINRLKLFKQNYGTSLSEAGILLAYQPLQNLSLKSAFVYRPGLLFGQMWNEVNAAWKVSEKFTFTAGRMLTPLGSVSEYFYSPANPGMLVPVIVSHQVMFPVKVNGISFSGSWGNQNKVSAGFFGGGYFSDKFLPLGPIGFFGKEDIYTEALENGITGNLPMTPAINPELLMAMGGSIGFNFKQVFQLGLNSFYGESETYYDPYDKTIAGNKKGVKTTFGINMGITLSSFHLSAEQWMGKVPVTGNAARSVSGGIFEVKNDFGRFTPYLKFENHRCLDIRFSRYSTGLNVKTMFQTTFKVEYFRFNFMGNGELKKYYLNGGLFSVTYAF